MTFTVPIAPSGNKMWRHNKKTGITYKTLECKNYQKEIGYKAKIEASRQGWQRTEGEKVVMEFMYYWPDNRNRDTGNQKKVILDGLEGVLYDNDRWVLERDLDWHIDRGNPRIEIKILKYQEVEQ